MKKIYTLSVLIFCFCIGLNSQHLHTVEFIESLTASELNNQTSIEVQNGIDLYKVTYFTTGSDGMPDTASGLFVVPDLDTDEHPVLIYHHGTSSSKTLVPSALELEFNLYAGLGGIGYTVLAPDYLGMGESRGFHPYVHRATQASASIDLLHAFTEWVDAGHTGWNQQLFLTGYSQGGHASMSTHWELETNYSQQYPVTAAAHLSGPYSISGVMFDHMMSEVDYLYLSYIPNAVLGFQEVYGDLYEDLEDIFKPQFIDNINLFYNGEIDLVDLNIRMIFTLYNLCNCTHPRQLFNPEFVDKMENEPNNLFMEHLRDNDTYAWGPQAPTRLFYCTGDDQVPYLNSVVADSAMRANGALDFDSEDFGNLNHGGCATPAGTSTIDFFAEFLETSSSLEKSLDRIEIYPNPSRGVIDIQGIENLRLVHLSLYDLHGRLLRQMGPSTTMDLSEFADGIYLLKIEGENEVDTRKIVLQK